ncbi:MAG: hypothetical protein ACOY9Y_10760 [Bacillota bacterium]
MRINDEAVRLGGKRQWNPGRCKPLRALLWLIGGLATAPIWLWLLGGFAK